MYALRVKDKSMKDYKGCLNPEVDKNPLLDSKITKSHNLSQLTLNILYQYKTNIKLFSPRMKNNARINNRHKINNLITE